MRPFPVIFILACVAFCDTTITVIRRDAGYRTPWDLSTGEIVDSGAKPFASLALIAGDRDILIGEGKRGWGLSKRLPFNGDFWATFYLRINTLPGVSAAPRDMDSLGSFLAFNFSGSVGPEYKRNLLQFRFNRSRSWSLPELYIKVVPSLDKAAERTLFIPVEPETLHCLEVSFSFRKDDSLVIAFYRNGLSCGEARTLYNYPREFTEMTVSEPFLAGNPLRLRLDRFTLSRDRFRCMPQRPRNPRETVNGPFVEMGCDSFASNYRDERLRSTRWRIRSLGDSLPPVFDMEENEPVFLDKRTCIFALDTGGYVWNARFTNHFGNAGDWSEPRPFRVTETKKPLIRITEVFISPAGGGKPVTGLAPDRWYRLTVRLRPETRWKDLGYLVAYLSHESYTLGNPVNKGGRFLAKRNYVLNLSVDVDKGTLGYYQKEMENSFSTRKILPDAPALYVDTRPGEMVLDTASGLARMAFKLLPDALPGKWTLSVYCGSADEIFVSEGRDRFSNLFRQPLSVVKPVPSSSAFKSVYLPALLAFLFLTALTLYFSKKKKAPDPVSETIKKDFEALKNHIRSHLKEEDITPDNIRVNLGFSRSYFYQILKRYGQGSLPKLVNQIRIEKAKELLIDPKKNITEIGYEVGFLESRYFSKVFKDLTDMTPSEYRDKLQKRV